MTHLPSYECYVFFVCFFFLLLLFSFTAAGVVLCGVYKMSPRTIVQFIFYFCSFEISENIPINQKQMILDSYSRQDPILIYISL